MKLSLFLFISLVIGSVGCSSAPPKNYFPFQSFLETELKNIDSLPIAIFKYHTANGKTDSTIIEKKEFGKIAKGLLFIDLQNENINKHYKELVLEDTDIKNISINYTTQNEAFPIKSIQINTTTGTTQVRSIYVERTETIDETLIIRKILWKSGKGVLINSSYYKNKQLLNNITEKFSWSIE